MTSAREALTLAKALLRGGERREAAAAKILRPENLFQPYTTTAWDRYPEEFAFVRAAAGDRIERILSFGCSSGDELLTLREYFPQARIHGIDVNPLAVRTARKRLRAAGASSVTVARGGDASSQTPASYDLVLALAVFRHGDLNAAPARCDAVLRFADFERTVAGLAACVRPGGLLVLRHANFRFTDCAVASSFEALRTGFASVGAKGAVTPVYGSDDCLVGLTGRDDGIYRRI
ncbi:MAG: hypothetical protein JWQ74_415 [Marmoricola sp.]|nr:hypothetical protein [Marmoricola sp.]